MTNKKNQISEVKIKQVFLILFLTCMVGLIVYNLSMFIPSLLGALTLYVVTRSFNFFLQDKKGWKPALSSLFIIFLCLVVLIIPLYLLGDVFLQRLGDSKQYMDKFDVFLKKIQEFIFSQTSFDVLSKENITKIQNFVAQISTTALKGTFNTLTVIASMFFMLYFMLEKPRIFEKRVSSAMPFKKTNIEIIGNKFIKLVMANAVGLPVVAIGQGLVALLGYYIFGTPSPMLLFAFTAISSMIPIVGAAIIYVPVSLFMIANGDTGNGIGILIYCLVVVGLTDNVLRFTLLKKLENIHPLNTVFGIILGVNLFGFMGLIFGPILVSMTILLFQIYRDEFSEKHLPKPEIPDPDPEIPTNDVDLEP